jgi:hypothetical protein
MALNKVTTDFLHDHLFKTVTGVGAGHIDWDAVTDAEFTAVPSAGPDRLQFMVTFANLKTMTPFDANLNDSQEIRDAIVKMLRDAGIAIERKISMFGHHDDMKVNGVRYSPWLTNQVWEKLKEYNRDVWIVDQQVKEIVITIDHNRIVTMGGFPEKMATSTLFDYQVPMWSRVAEATDAVGRILAESGLEYDVDQEGHAYFLTKRT